MPSESYVETILVAATSGAGLVLAFYTLALGKADKTLSKRNELLEEVIGQYRQAAQQVSAETGKERLKHLDTLTRRISGLQGLPWYMTGGVMVTFVLYLVAVILSFYWLANPANDTTALYSAANFAFLIATIFFLYDGIAIISDINAGLIKPTARTQPSGSHQKPP